MPVYIGSGQPHVSSDDSNQASAYGKWEDKNKDGSCPERADVEVWLQMYACRSDIGPCGWIRQGHREDRVRKGFKSGRRVTVRADCASKARARWRNVVDVDIPDQFDHPLRATRQSRQVESKHSGQGAEPAGSFCAQRFSHGFAALPISVRKQERHRDGLTAHPARVLRWHCTGDLSPSTRTTVMHSAGSVLQ